MSLQTPEYIQASGIEYTAEDVRYQLSNMGQGQLGECVVGLPDYRVTQRAAGANMSVDVAAGSGWVRGDTAARQGLYHVVNDATVNVVISAADSTDPRIDQIVLRVYDDSYDGSGDNMAALEVVAGTPTTGADLDNRDGAAALPDTAMRLADILVDAGATSVTDAEIASHRNFQDISVVSERGWGDLYQYPDVGWGDNYDATLLLRHPLNTGPSTFQNTNWIPAYYYTYQVTAVVCQRHIRANTARWWYRQAALMSSTELTGTYEIGLYDVAGVNIFLESKSFSGAVTDMVVESVTFDEYSFEPGSVFYAGLWISNDLAGDEVAAWCYPTSADHLAGLPQIHGGRDSFGLPDRLVNESGGTITSWMGSGSFDSWIPVIQLSAE